MVLLRPRSIDRSIAWVASMPSALAARLLHHVWPTDGRSQAKGKEPPRLRGPFNPAVPTLLYTHARKSHHRSILPRCCCSCSSSSLDLRQSVRPSRDGGSSSNSSSNSDVAPLNQSSSGLREEVPVGPRGERQHLLVVAQVCVDWREVCVCVGVNELNVEVV
jgi:hypothetical protein